MTVARILTWNLEWGRRGPVAVAAMRQAITAAKPDIACLTEALTSFPDAAGHVIEGGPDWGYPPRSGQRKVLLWSRQPWEMVDALGSVDLPSGRYVAGRTATPLGPLTVIGVCIPWDLDHVRYGRRDSRPWQRHAAFLQALGPILARHPTATVLAGDFNQRIPRDRQPVAMAEAMAGALRPHFAVATTGDLPPLSVRVIDHIAHTADLRPGQVTALPKGPAEGLAWTDHFGTCVELKGTA